MIQKLLWSIFCVSLPSAAFATSPSTPWYDIKVPGLSSPLKCHREDPSRCVIRIRAGERAPMDGVLESFGQQSFLQMRADPVRLQERIAVAVRTATATAANRLRLEKRYRAIDNLSWADKINRTNDNHARQLKAVRPEWYEEPLFVIPATITLVLGVVAASAAIACKLQGCRGNQFP